MRPNLEPRSFHQGQGGAKRAVDIQRAGIEQMGIRRLHQGCRSARAVALVAGDNIRKDSPLVDLLAATATRLGATPAQVALAWLLAKRPWIVPIPGTKRRERLEENVAATSLDLSTDDVRELEAAAERVEVQGDRYTEQMQRSIDR